MVSHFLSPEINEPVPLYKGPIQVERRVNSDQIEENKCINSEGVIHLTWLPETRLEYKFCIEVDKGIKFVDSDLLLRIEDLGIELKVYALNDHWVWRNPLRNKDAGKPAIKIEVSGLINTPIQFGRLNSPIRFLSFHLANFVNIDSKNFHLEGGINDVDRASMRLLLSPHRLKFNFGEWTVIISSIENFKANRHNLDGYNIQRRLASQSGFAITNVGVICRSNGENFLHEESEIVLDAISYFLSFFKASWIHPMFLSGVNSQYESSWIEWRSKGIGIWKNRDFSTKRIAEFSAIFYKKWTQEVWRNPLRLAIHWFVESSNKAGGVEGSIILIQNAFELLSCVYVVEHKRIISKTVFNKLTAAEKIRLLFSQAEVPLAIPIAYKDLIDFAKEINADDIPQILVQIRNKIVHADSGNLKKLSRISLEVRSQAHQVGCLSLESILFKIFSDGCQE